MNRFNRIRTTLLASSLIATAVAAPAQAQSHYVAPFLQHASPTSIWVTWEMMAASDGVIEYGTTEALGDSVDSASVQLVGGGVLHEGQLSGLSPNTRYYYRVTAGEYQSEVADFVTPAVSADEAPIRMVAMSDMQLGRQPLKFREIIEDGVIGWVEDMYGEALSDALDVVLIPGDLVSSGPEHDDWTDEFFDPIAPLIRHVPVYPVPGNHENDHHFFFDYFNFPSNGSAAYDGHWWTFDISNVRVIGLDTNGIYGLTEQPDWLVDVLDDTCDDPTIDFVFAQFHHPAESELWVVGETGFARQIVEELGNFSTRCGKPSIHFYGHTHGYARGQSRDHDHVSVNVATAGGSIDEWGEYPHWDYESTVKSYSDYGFVVLDVQAGDSPEFSLTRVSRGDASEVLDNTVNDTIRIRRDNEPPARPTPIQPAGSQVAAECATLMIADDYADPDGDAFQGVHWQVAETCDGFDAPVAEDWQQSENWYYEEDLQADADFTRSVLRDLPADSDLCWRVRVRDEGLRWSPWSVAVPFHSNAAQQTDNLLTNAGAENGLDDWTIREGNVAASPGRECGGQYPQRGRRLFVLGGPCEPTALAELAQRVDLSAWSDEIDAGTAMARFSAGITTVQGEDNPSIQLEFLDETDAPIGTPEVASSNAPRWVTVDRIVEIPTGARAVNVVLVGERNAADGEADPNHSYFDNVRLYVMADGVGPDACDAPGDGEIPDGPIVGEDVGPDAGGDVGVDAGPDTGEDVGEDTTTPDVVEMDVDDMDASGADGSGDGTDVGEGDAGAGTVSGGTGCSTSGSGAPWTAMLAAFGLLAYRRRR